MSGFPLAMAQVVDPTHVLVLYFVVQHRQLCTIIAATVFQRIRLLNCQALAPNPKPQNPKTKKTKTKGPWADTKML